MKKLTITVGLLACAAIALWAQNAVGINGVPVGSSEGGGTKYSHFAYTTASHGGGGLVRNTQWSMSGTIKGDNNPDEQYRGVDILTNGTTSVPAYYSFVMPDVASLVLKGFVSLSADVNGTGTATLNFAYWCIVNDASLASTSYTSIGTTGTITVNTFKDVEDGSVTWSSGLCNPYDLVKIRVTGADPGTPDNDDLMLIAMQIYEP